MPRDLKTLRNRSRRRARLTCVSVFPHVSVLYTVAHGTCGYTESQTDNERARGNGTMKSKKQSDSLIAAERNGVKSEAGPKESSLPPPPKPQKKGEHSRIGIVAVLCRGKLPPLRDVLVCCWYIYKKSPIHGEKCSIKNYYVLL